MASGTPKRAVYWDPPGHPDEIPAKRMCLTTPLTPTAAPRMDISDGIPMKRRRLDYMGTPLTSTMADEIYPSPCGDMTAPMTSGDASGKTPEGSWPKSHPETQDCPPDGCPLAGTSTEGEGRPQVNPDEPMFTYSQVEQICENIWKERETWIRQEYDRILSLRLAEQHESFVKFTYEQIQQKLQETAPTYMS